MVAKGDVVTVDLQVKDVKTGKPFDSTFDQGQVRFVVGAGGFLPAIHKAVEKMQVGEAKELQLSGDDAYGDADEALIATLPLDQAPPNLQRGQVLRLWTGQKARVTDVTADAFTLDMNRLNAGAVLSVALRVLDAAPPSTLETADFAAGCFWGLELAFQRAPGVVSTKVGYTQGAKKDPTYTEVCAGTTGHAEAVRVLFDPAQTTFDALLDVFWGRHDPTQLNGQGNDLGTQYRGGVYYHSEAQKAAIEESRAREQAKHDKPIVTEVLPAATFWDAEDYHQQYLEKGGQIAKKAASETIRCYG
ncbi:peptide methionine sulfoxide reductase [Tribonema minus]|uniref:peptidylprolyl isomerase n=1 Tax=Tribonema minus TaxID=303371 RepID=A0A835ZFH4_9STRA|nr:peptide methionine sulfoxide reductase [Tribonema minus]